MPIPGIRGRVWRRQVKPGAAGADRYRATVAVVIFALVASALHLAPASASGSASYRSDDFSGGLDPSRWDFVDPLGDGTAEVVDGRLRLSVPGGSSHNAWVVNEAPRLMQAASGTAVDLTLSFGSVPSRRYQTQGLIVAGGGDDYLRFDVHHDGSRLRAYAASFVSGAATVRINATMPAPPSGAPILMNVVRGGDGWTYRYSFDGESWTTAGSFSQTLTPAAAGPFVGNWSANGTSANAFTAVVDRFEDAAEPLTPEPDPEPAAPVISGVSVIAGIGWCAGWVDHGCACDVAGRVRVVLGVWQ
jgi:hypothetical protein